MFGKFMNKKFFHPGSYPNVKLRWIHEQRHASRQKNEEEKKATYQKEQESYQSRMLSAKSSEEKMKLDLNFLYDLPPGMKNNDDRDDEETKEKEFKFEWQKNAPRSRYVNDLDLECADQPFGVCVRNIRCFKCRAWGHQNTDRECPLFFVNVNSEENNKNNDQNLRLSDPLLLVSKMKEQHGLCLKKSVIGKEIDPMADNQQLVLSEDDDDDELGNADMNLIESLTDKQKRKLLKHLNRAEKKERKMTRKKKKRKKRHKNEKIKRGHYSSSSSSDSDDNSTNDNAKLKRHYSTGSEDYMENIKRKKTNCSSEDEHCREKYKKIKEHELLTVGKEHSSSSQCLNNTTKRNNNNTHRDAERKRSHSKYLRKRFEKQNKLTKLSNRYV